MKGKDYKTITTVLKNTILQDNTFENQVKVMWVAEQLATVFEIENPRFNREKFLAACKGKTNEQSAT